MKSYQNILDVLVKMYLDNDAKILYNRFSGYTNTTYSVFE
jgi:hypothetical protein